mmetsp:Transcript_3528/g.4145  ORF Transcript_3528/g.4145 Transcript_3528/m.4145 type:complete len:561 (-) Transcript_3528:1764-3446(-)
MGNDTSTTAVKGKKKVFCGCCDSDVITTVSKFDAKDQVCADEGCEPMELSTSSMTEKKQQPKKDPHQPTPPEEEPSVLSFGGGTARRRNSIFNNVIVTDSLTDVRQRYHINPKEIGHGHYGVVRKCMDRETKEWYAIKSIQKSKVSKIDVLKREIEILAEVDHKNIIKLIEVHEDVKYLHLITELCTGGELFDRIIAKTQTPEGHFSEEDAAKLVASILKAIRYCHDDLHIVHRDLKPENFLFVSHDEGAPIKIIDFGLSRHETDGTGIMRTKVGTPYYVAPEVLRKEYTKSCDMWSIGVITYILLCGYPPFYGDSDTQIFECVKAGKFDFPSPEWDTISHAAKDFVCCLLKLDQSKRLPAAQALQHEWIQKVTARHRSSIVQLDNVRSVPFQKFMGLQKLRKAALGFIATHLTETEVGSLGELFERLDIDGDGSLTLDELEAALKLEELNFDLLEKITSLRQELSLSGKEAIKWKDFLAAMADKSLLIKEEKIRMAFDHFRKNENACVRISDLLDLVGGEDGAKEIIDLNQLDGKLEITYEEFRSMLTDSFSDSSDQDM